MSESRSTAVAIVGTESNLGTLLHKKMTAMSSVLPRHLTPERMARLVLLAANRTPLLLKCTQESVLQAVMQAATLGLEINSGLGTAYLVPYFNTRNRVYEAQFIPGYRGLIELARRGGDIRIEARLVIEGDHFKVKLGSNPHIDHEPSYGDGEVTHAYAVAKFPDGSELFEVMTRKQLDDIKARSKANENGPWKTDEHEMMRKTVVRRLCKYLPLSPELAAAIEAGDRADVGDTGNVDPLLDGLSAAGVRASEVTSARLAEAKQKAAGASRRLAPPQEVPAGVDASTGEDTTFEPPREREPGEEG